MKQFVLAGLLITAAAGAFAADQAVADRYAKACTVCHAVGVANAPKAFDVEAWKPRLAKGEAALLGSVKNGLGAMPPRGLCPDCSDADYKALIAYMSSPKK